MDTLSIPPAPSLKRSFSDPGYRHNQDKLEEKINLLVRYQANNSFLTHRATSGTVNSSERKEKKNRFLQSNKHTKDPNNQQSCLERIMSAFMECIQEKKPYPELSYLTVPIPGTPPNVLVISRE